LWLLRGHGVNIQKYPDGILVNSRHYAEAVAELNKCGYHWRADEVTVRSLSSKNKTAMVLYLKDVGSKQLTWGSTFHKGLRVFTPKPSVNMNKLYNSF